MFRFFRKYLILLLFFFNIIQSQEEIVLRLDTEDKNLPFGLTTKTVKDLPEVGIVLSGGGSRSLAQIGVLEALEEKNINFDILVGTSMGSIIGGLYAAGYSLTDLDSIVSVADWQDFLSANETDRNELFIDQKVTQDKAIVTLRLKGLNPILPTAVSSGHKISNFFTLLTLNAPIHAKYSFDEFEKKFRAVSTDLVTGDMKILDRGSLSQAMRASSSVSFLLAPVKVDSMLLVDGGLVSNLPVSTAIQLGSDFTIAVNTTSPLHSREELNYPWNVADQIVSIPMQKLNDNQLKLADYIIQPDLPPVNGFDFNQTDSLVDEAYRQTMRKTDLKNKIENLYKSAIEKKPRILGKLKLSDNSSALEKEVYQKYKNKTVTTSDLCLALKDIIDSGYYKDVVFNISAVSSFITLKIQEEKNPLITGVTVNVNSDYVKELTHPCLQGLVNTTYNSKIISKRLLTCLRKFRRDGFSLIDVNKVSFNERTGQLTISFSDGIIDDLLIQGNRRTDEKLISREISLEKGKLFKYHDLESSLTGLRSTNLFEEVEVALLKIGEKNIITFNLKERPTELLRFGFRTDNENQTQILLDIRDENFWGTGTELGAIFTGGSRIRSIIIEHKVNRLFDTYLTYKLRAFHGFEDVNVYKEVPQTTPYKFENQKTGEYRYAYSGFSFALGTQVKKLGNIIAEIKYQNDIIKDKLNYTGETYSTDLFSLKFALNIDSQDKFPYPTSGIKINSFYETAQTLLTGDVGFSKLFFDYKGFISFNENNVISPSLLVGFADETLPLSQQFSFGGQHNFFGFREKEYRGRQIFISSLEYRFKLPIKIFFDTYIKAHYDLGSIWKQPEDIKFKDFKHGLGFTVSLDTPIGPADFSVGKGFLIKNIFPDNIISWGDTMFYFTIGYYQ
jgi:NTE family protein